MTSTIEPPYASGRARADIERALTAAGKEVQALQASDLAMLEDFHSLGRLATVALLDLAHVSAGDRVLDAGTGIGGAAPVIAAQRGAPGTPRGPPPGDCGGGRGPHQAGGLGRRIDVGVR